MKYSILSVVTGTSKCTVPFKPSNATKHIPQGCQFCVSGQYANDSNRVAPEVNWRNLRKAIQLAHNGGVDTVVLTGRGEPTYFPDQITDYLKVLGPEFPLIELQTNGVLLSGARNDDYLKEWYDLGLTTILISVVSNDPEILRQNYMPLSKSYYDLPALIAKLRGIGYTVRLACVCTKAWMSTREQVSDFLEFAKDNKVGQVTLRPLNDEYRRETAHAWIQKHKMTDKDKEGIRDYLDEVGHKLRDLPAIGTMYDVGGVGVLMSLPLTKYTHHNTEDTARNLIFFPDGTTRYDWEWEGSVLLQGDNRPLTLQDGSYW